MKHLKIIIISALFFTACESIIFQPEPADNPRGNFESLWQTFDTKYAVFEQRHVDWDEMYSIYRPQINKNSSDNELHSVIISMLAHLDDAHVSLMAPGKPYWNGHQEFRQPTGIGLFDFDVVLDKYLNNQFTNYNNQIVYGLLEDNIGYIFVNHFSGERLTVIDKILKDFKDTKGIIIDLRGNGGGDFTTGLVLASRFADQKRLAFKASPKNGPGKKDYADPVNYYIEPAGPNRYLKPVVVLTDRYTISAGESIVLFLRVLPHVTVIGENTTGALGERIEKEMPNGWVYSLTGQIITAADGNCYEGPGIPPDIHVNNTLFEVKKGIDKVLNTAVNEILM